MSRYKPQQNKQLGKAFVLNGEPAFFRFGGNALAELEGVLGMTQNEIFQLATKQELSIRLTRAMLWAALLHETPDLTIKEAGEILDPYMQDQAGFQELTLALADAFILAFPKVTEDDSKNAAAPISTGGPNTGESAPVSA